VADSRQAYERLWVATLQSEWRTLAIVPAHRAASGREVAAALAAVGSEYRGRPVELLHAEGLQLGGCRALLERLEGLAEPHALVLSLDSPLDSQSALLVARAADAALLVVPLGATPFGQARQAIEAVGRARFLGAVTLPEPTP
jgi:hypothetical protein